MAFISISNDLQIIEDIVISIWNVNSQYYITHYTLYIAVQTTKSGLKKRAPLNQRRYLSKITGC